MIDNLLSIVVPVYNVAPYLDRSIQSILQQTYRDIEVILVNDGSTDESKEICEKYARLDSRVKLISQENQGAAIARYNGVWAASGQYITFADPDDYIDLDLYEQLIKCAGDYDIIICKWLRESDSNVRCCGDTIRLGAYTAPEDKSFLLQHLINVSLPGGTENICSGIAAYLWNKLFKADLIRNVMEDLISVLSHFNDDRPVIYSAMLRCKSVLLTDICGYHYQVRKDSVAHTPDRCCRYIKSMCQFYEFMEPLFSKESAYNVLLPQLQLKLSVEIARGTVRMGFPKQAQLQLRTPIFPYLNLLDGKRIALYGAGNVGLSYHRQVRKWNVCRIVLWVDHNWEEHARAGLAVSPIERLLDSDYDVVILALEDQVSADLTKQELVSMGIKAERILWKPPFEM